MSERSVLVTGGAGFIGSHLVDRLLARGDRVLVVDNFFLGSRANLADAEASGGPLTVHYEDAADLPAMRELFDELQGLAGALPVPSTRVPPRITRSCMESPIE